MRTWRELQKLVGEWSREQFGEQDTRNQALGVIEEFSEYLNAAEPEDEIDAVADAMIFLLDFCEREGIEIEECIALRVPIQVARRDSYLFSVSAGRLARALLKRSQGIRGYEDPAFARREIMNAVGMVYGSLHELVRWTHDLLAVTEETALKVVQRNWKANKRTGGES